MIKYNLICHRNHEFEAWFSKGADFDNQAGLGQILCAYCDSTKIEKAIMAPAVSTSRAKEASREKAAAGLKAMGEIASKIREDIAQNCDDVGDKFADEARAIHYGEKPARGIYGAASPKDAAALADEGVAIAPLPDMLVPKKKEKLN